MNQKFCPLSTFLSGNMAVFVLMTLYWLSYFYLLFEIWENGDTTKNRLNVSRNMSSHTIRAVENRDMKKRTMVNSIIITQTLYFEHPSQFEDQLQAFTLTSWTILIIVSCTLFFAVQLEITHVLGALTSGFTSKSGLYNMAKPVWLSDCFLSCMTVIWLWYYYVLINQNNPARPMREWCLHHVMYNSATFLLYFYAHFEVSH